MIRELRENDILACAKILCSVYNNDLWKNHWELSTAKEYLLDFYRNQKFVGYVALEDETIVGALFAREKIWWSNSEIHIEEFFVIPENQHTGIGTLLLKKLKEYAKAHGLVGITLSCNRHAPAKQFFEKNGFASCRQALFMTKEI